MNEATVTISNFGCLHVFLGLSGYNNKREHQQKWPTDSTQAYGNYTTKSAIIMKTHTIKNLIQKYAQNECTVRCREIPSIPKTECCVLLMCIWFTSFYICIILRIFYLLLCIKDKVPSVILCVIYCPTIYCAIILRFLTNNIIFKLGKLFGDTKV